MSLIIGYYGENGAVVVGDKRNIMFRGNPEKREKIEKKLYSGEIKSEEELKKLCEENNIQIFIEDERNKIKKIDNVVIGEVRSIGLDSKRRRMYLTKGRCVILDILNDDITNKVDKGGSGIVMFGNKYLKDKVAEELKKHSSKLKDMKIEEVKDLLVNIVKNKCDGPTISDDLDVEYTDKCAIDIDSIIEKDIEELREYRNDLKNKMIDFKKVMVIADKIEKNGVIGVIKNGKLVLDDNHLAIDKICPNPTIYSEIDIEGNVEDGDIIVIENGTLKVKDKDIPVSVNKIICKK